MAGDNALRISHFRVEEQLSRDELGYFFRAVDEQLDRPVVLRVVRAAQVENVGPSGPIRQRIRSQARAASLVNHPNLVTIYEYRSLAETDIVVMELVEGRTLQELRNAGRRWTVVELAGMLARLGDALAAAHAGGLVHGNVNAANVRIRPDGRFKLLDLGIPKLDTVDDSVPHDASDDVRGLARMTCGLLGPPIDVHSEGVEGESDPLSDPTAARAHYGFLAPVLRMALRDAQGYPSGGAFRDAVLEAMESASSRSGKSREIDRSFSTHVLGPSAAGVVEDLLPAESPVFEPIGLAARSGAPRLVLPADLAERASREPFDPNTIRLTIQTPKWHSRLGRFFRPRVLVVAALTVAVALAAVVFQRRDGVPVSAATLEPTLAEATGTLTDPVPGDSLVVAATDPAAGDEGDENTTPGDETLAASAPGVPTGGTGSTPVFTAPVRVTPTGSTIRALDGDGGPWTDTAEIGVPAGDTRVLEFSRAGYVTQRHDFAGRRLSVALQPDSAIVRFRSNVSADVFRSTAGGEVRIGTTDVDVRLPTGNHRFVYRSPGQPDWNTTVAMTSPGGTYDVSKSDYVTVGSLVATAAPTWARVSVNGGLPRETPATFDSLAVGRHVVTVTREGFATIVDTVLVSAGEIARRSYTIRR
jgi:hypothetical protein